MPVFDNAVSHRFIPVFTPGVTAQIEWITEIRQLTVRNIIHTDLGFGCPGQRAPAFEDLTELAVFQFQHFIIVISAQIFIVLEQSTYSDIVITVTIFQDGRIGFHPVGQGFRIIIVEIQKRTYVYIRFHFPHKTGKELHAGFMKGHRILIVTVL